MNFSSFVGKKELFGAGHPLVGIIKHKFSHQCWRTVVDNYLTGHLFTLPLVNNNYC